MRLPYVAPIVAIYLALVVITVIPGITHQVWFIEHFWAATPFRVTGLLLAPAIFACAFVIKRWFAVFVPVAGILFGALLLRYGAQFPAEFSDTAQPGFASVVWNALKDELLEALVVVGFGLLAATHWAPRAGIDGELDDLGRGRKLALLPPRSEVIVAFFVFFVLTTLIDLIRPEHALGYMPELVLASISGIASVLVFFVIFTVNRWWSIVFPALIVCRSILVFLTQPGCGGATSDCLSAAGEIALKFAAPAFGILFFIALLAAQWARPSANAQSGSEPADESGENSISSSLFPAGSDT